MDKVSTTLVKLFWISRPVSWVNTSYPFAATFLLLSYTINLDLFVGSLFFLIPYNYLMYGLNDVFDYESDIKNPRKQSIEGAIADKALHRLIVITSIVLSVPFIAYMAYGNPLRPNLILLLSIFFVVAYSAPVLRFKERAFLDSFTSAMHFVLPMIYAMTLFGWQPEYWLLFGAFTAWAMASHAFGAVQDIIPDRAAGIGSIASSIGAATTVKLSMLLYLLAGLLVFIYSTSAFTIALTSLLYFFNISKWRNVSTKDSPKTNSSWRRFIYLNFVAGAIITITLVALQI